MSAPLINRSLTTIRTELEFLHDSEVITEQVYNTLMESLPRKYQKDMEAWGVDRLKSDQAESRTPVQTGTDSITNGLASTSINPPVKPERLQTTKALGYCKAIYDYQAQEREDLKLKKEDKIAVVEHLSEDWWKGYKKGSSQKETGVFPSNYVNVISQQEFDLGSDPTGRSVTSPYQDEKASYNPNENFVPVPQHGQAQTPALTQQPSYGGYAQYPPPSSNYYPPQQYSPQPQTYQPQDQQAQVATPDKQQQHAHMRKFGGKLGNAAIFGAGATIGSDLVHSIF